MGARFCLVYLTVISALGYAFSVGQITPIRGILDFFLLLAVVCVFVPKPFFTITAAVAGVINAAGVLYVIYPFLRFALSGLGSVFIIVGPWKIPGLPGVLLAVVPVLLSSAFCVLLLFHEPEPGESEAR